MSTTRQGQHCIEGVMLWCKVLVGIVLANYLEAYASMQYEDVVGVMCTSRKHKHAHPFSALLVFWSVNVNNQEFLYLMMV